MEAVQVPNVPKNMEGTERVEAYLNNLKGRFKELIRQHNELIQNSVDIIQEIDEVTSKASFVDEKNVTRVKTLIREFERAGEGVNNDKSHSFATKKVIIGDVASILKNFEKLNESHVLRDSLFLMKRTKDNLTKIDTFFDGVTEENSKKLEIPVHDIKRKTNKATKSQVTYSGCSSVSSLDVNITNNRTSANVTDNGYQGDIDDSEYNLLAIKKRKHKNSGVTM